MLSKATVTTAIGAALSALALASTAHAADTVASDGDITVGKHAHAIIVDLRVTDVDPVGSSPIVTAAGAATGLNAHVDSDVIPSLGIQYFLTDHIAAELILGTSKHTISAVGAGGSTVVRKTWVLPPTLTAQYHFAPKSRFSPYVGAGVNYMIFYSGKDYSGFTVRTHDGFGPALQAGADYAVTRRVNLNLDVKKIFFRTDASIDGGALKSHVQLDPWVISAGLGLKF